MKEEDNEQDDLLPEDQENHLDFSQQIAVELSVFKEDLIKMRESFKERDPVYKGIVDDQTYKVLLEKADYFETEIINDDDYPFRKKFRLAQERTRKARNIFQKNTSESTDLKGTDNKTYQKNEDGRNAGRGIANSRSRNLGNDTADYVRAGFKNTKKDLEKIIGEDLVLKAGVVIILTALTFLYRYLVNQDIIGYNGRIFTGFAIGCLLYYGSFRTLRTFRNMSTWLVIGGILLHYYTIYVTFNDYNYINATEAFVICLVSTALAVLFSVLYDKVELSVFAIAGGYIAPILVGKDDHTIFFFSYVISLNIGMMTLAYFKRWKFINFVSYISTLAFFLLWYVRSESTEENAYAAFIFATAFYVVFFLMNLLYTLRADIKATSFDYKIHFSNTILYFILGAYTLRSYGGHDFVGHFAASIAIFNLVYTLLLYTHEHMDYEILELFISFAIFFTSLFVPLYFDKTNITFIWATEAAMLYFIGLKTSIRVLKDSAIYVSILSIFSLFMVWYLFYVKFDVEVSLFLNNAFLAGLTTTFSLFAIVFMMLKERDKDFKLAFMPMERWLLIFGGVVIVVGYGSGIIELYNFSDQDYGNAHVKVLIVGIYTLLFMLLLRFMVRLTDLMPIRVISGVVMGLAVLVYPFYGHFSTVFLRDAYKYSHTDFWQFGLHYPILVLSLTIAYLLIRDIVNSEGYVSGKYSYAIWFMASIVTFHASAELDHLMVFFSDEFALVEHTLHLSRRVGYTILWSLTSMTFMLFGMRYRIKDLRIVALVLFGLTVGKLFAYDIWFMGPIGKLISSLFIGLLLVGVSFLYKKKSFHLLVDKGEISFDATDQYNDKKEQTDEIADLQEKIIDELEIDPDHPLRNTDTDDAQDNQP